MYTVCTLTMFCIYNVCTLYVQMMYLVHTVYILYTEHFQKQVCTYKLHHFRNSLKEVCTEYALRLKASQKHIPNQSKHSFQSSHFWFCTPAPVPLAGGAAGCYQRIGRLRVSPSRAGLRCSARPCCQIEGA